MRDQDRTSDFAWVDSLLSRSVHLVLPRVEIVLPNSGRVSGRGRVRWSGGNFPVFSAITDKLPDSEQWSPGRKVLCVSDEGSSVEISTGENGKLTSGNECTDWELPCERITVRRELTELPPELQPEDAQLTGVFDPWPLRVAGRASTTRDDNPAFGRTIETGDWGKITVDGTDFVFREIGGACRFRLRATNPETTWKICASIHVSLNFLFGCRARLRGWQQMAGPSMENVLLGNRPKAMRRTYPPLDNFLWRLRWGPTGFEQPLALASSFFLSPTGMKVNPLLHLLWDTADLEMESRLLTAATVLEGLVRNVETCEETPMPLGDQVLRYVEDLMPNGSILARWRGLLAGMGGMHVPTILRQWVSDGRHQASEEERQAFVNRRHPLAHGSMLADATDPAAGRDLALLMNLVNKVVLTQMGYRGPFADYSVDRDYSRACPIIV